MTIRRFSIVLGVAVSIALSALALGLLVGAIRSLWATQQAAYSGEVIGTLSTAVIELSLERSLVQVTLALDPPIERQYRDMIDEQRRKVADGFARLSVIVNDDERGRHLLRSFETGLSSLEDLRAEADRLLALPLSDRDPDFLVTWSREVPTIIADLERLGQVVRSPLLNIPVQILNLERLQHLSWAIREYGGRERTMMAILVARGEPVTEADLVQMRAFNDTVLRRWAGIETLRDSLPDALAADVDALETGYFDTYGRVREQILSEAPAGSFAISFDEYFAASTVALGLAEYLSARAVETALETLRTLRLRASLLVAMYAVILIAAVVLSNRMRRYLTGHVAGRIEMVSETARRLADGDYDTEIRAADAGGDEVASTVRAIETLRISLRHAREIERSAHHEREAAERRRTESLASMATTVSHETSRVVDETTTRMDSMDETVGTMAASADAIGRDATRVSIAMQDVLASSEQVGASTENMRARFADMSSRAQESVRLAGEADEAGSRAAREIGDLAAAVARIRSVTTIIADIAARTRLLAVNASIEAARAGAAGRGFSVVAGEVKNLAVKTAQSTDEIEAIAADVELLTTSAVGTVQGMSRSIGANRTSAADIGQAIEEQVRATSEITRAVESVVEAVRDVSGQMERFTEETSRSSELAAAVTAASGEVRTSLTRLQSVLTSALRSAAPEAFETLAT